MNGITGKINDGKGTIGKLVNEEETVDNINEALSSVKNTLGKLDQLRVDLAFSAERFGETDKNKGHVRLRLTPGEKRYYLLGLSSHPDGITEKTNTTIIRDYSTASAETDFSYTEKKEEQKPGAMTWTLQYAHRFYDDFFFRVGLLESEAGLGMDYLPLDGEKEHDLTLSFDAYDFPDSDESRKVHTKAGIKYKFFKNLFVTGGYDDILNSETDSWFVGAGVEFRDDDLKYLLGKTPMPN